MDSPGVSVGVVLGILLIGFFQLWAVLMRIIKAGPNEVLVISGRQRWIRREDGTKFLVGFRMLKGGRTFVWPFLERVDRLSLEPMNIKLATNNIQTRDRNRINIDGLATVKIGPDDVSIAMAAQNFLSKTPEELNSFLSEYIEAKLRNIVGMMPSEEVYAGRDTIVGKLKSVFDSEFEELGLKLVSVSVSEISESDAEQISEFMKV